MSQTSEASPIPSSLVRQHWLPTKEAVREVIKFERRFGETHLKLACLAALPLILTPELLNLIRINFQSIGQEIPWVAEVDFLLSSLCHPIGEELYEIEPSIREVLMVELENQFGWRILFDIARFLQAYVERQNPKTNPEVNKALSWIARAYLDPDQVVQEIAESLEKIGSEPELLPKLQGQLQVVLIAEVLAEPLGEANEIAFYHKLVKDCQTVAKDLYEEDDEEEGEDDPTPDLELFAGEYICAVKWGGDTGSWHEGTEHLVLSAPGAVQFRSRFGTATIQNLQIEGNTFSWLAEDNQTAAEFTFKEDSEDSYFWDDGQAGKLFQGWLQYPNEGRIDFRGKRDETVVDLGVDLQAFEFDIVEFVEKEETKLPKFDFEYVTVDASGQEIDRRSASASYFEEALGDVPLQMVAIPGNSFLMGSPEDEPKRSPDESPQHQVTVPPFFMGKYPVTQAQWRFVAGLPQGQRELKPEPSRFKGDDLPVENVSWNDVMEFCDRLSQYTGREYRLPSEAEWEYACRAGTITPFHFGETITAELANYDASRTYREEAEGEDRQKTTPVGSFLPNAFGLYDMHGNVDEWCADRWHENYEGAPTDGSAWLNQSGDPDSKTEESLSAEHGEDLDQEEARGSVEKDEDNIRYVLRGGSWYSNPQVCRSAYRNTSIPTSRSATSVFGLSLPPPGLLSPLLFCPLYPLPFFASRASFKIFFDLEEDYLLKTQRYRILHLP